MGRCTKFIKKEKLIVLIFLTALFLRLRFVSPWLEDWDSVQFALALNDFDITKHQPHPPGYPLYILLAKLFYFFIHDDTKSLTFLSAFLGSLAVIPLYYLARKMFNHLTALLASSLFIFMPVEWILSEIPISNIPGLFFLLLSAYFMYTSAENPKRLVFAVALAGIVQGVRPTDFPIVISLLGLLIVRNLNFKYAIFTIVAFLVSLMLWLLPLILITGLQEFINAHVDVAKYAIWHNILLGHSFNPVDLIVIRLKSLLKLLEFSYTQYFLILCSASIVWMLRRKKVWQAIQYQFLWVWLGSYGLILIFLHNLELPQYTLPLLPPLVIIVAHMTSILLKTTKNKVITIAVFAIIIMILINYSKQELLLRSDTTPPTLAPVFYVKENFDPDNTTLITTFTYRQFQYYAPEFKNYYGSQNTPEIIDTDNVIIDYEGLKKETAALGGYEIEHSEQFSEPKLFFSRLTKTNIYILRKG